jgi:hypothetical protein
MSQKTKVPSTENLSDSESPSNEEILFRVVVYLAEASAVKYCSDVGNGPLDGKCSAGAEARGPIVGSLLLSLEKSEMEPI